MLTRDKLKEIESKYDFRSVTMKDLEVWLHIRGHFYVNYFEKDTKGNELTTSRTFSLIKASFRGIFKWFKHYDYWVITSSNLRKKVNGKSQNILFDYPASQLGKTLFIELPLFKHASKKDIYTKELSSKAFLLILETLYSKLFLRKAKIIKHEILQNIAQEYDVNIDYISLSKRMVSQYKVMQWLLKRKKPKAILINTPYTNFGYIKAFKEKNIPVIEFQHGTIGKDHFSYNIFTEFDQNYFPDYLLSLGEGEREIFKHPNCWKYKKGIIPIGSFIIQNILQNFKEDNSITALKEKYDYTFCVSLQETERGNKLIDELTKIAQNNESLLFIFCPRSKSEKELREKYNLPNNIVFTPRLNVYEAILHSDFHITIYSTCALEAPSLGIRNILYNIDNKSYTYYNDVLSSETTFYVNNEKEFLNVLKTNKKATKTEIQKANNNVITSEYFKNINNFLEVVIKNKER